MHTSFEHLTRNDLQRSTGMFTQTLPKPQSNFRETKRKQWDYDRSDKKFQYLLKESLSERGDVDWTT